MKNELTQRIKQVIASNPAPVIYYHEDNEWSIYPSSTGGAECRAAHCYTDELLDGNDHINKKEFAPELVVALAEMLGITVMSGGRAR